LDRRSAMTASDIQCRLEVPGVATFPRFRLLLRSLCAETVAAVHTSRRSIVAHAIPNRPGLDCGRHALWTCRTKSTLDSRTWLSAAPESRLSRNRSAAIRHPGPGDSPQTVPLHSRGNSRPAPGYTSVVAFWFVAATHPLHADRLARQHRLAAGRIHPSGASRCPIGYSSVPPGGPSYQVLQVAIGAPPSHDC
jgi:hypothetical protein